MRNKSSKKIGWIEIAVVFLVFIILLLITGRIVIAKEIDKGYGVRYMPYDNKLDSIGSGIHFDVTAIETAIGAEHGEIDLSFSNTIYNLLGDYNEYVDFAQRMQEIISELEYVENLKKTGELRVPEEANGISTELIKERLKQLQISGNEMDFIANSGIYMWRSLYRYYFAKEDSEDIFILLTYDQFIIQTRIYFKSDKIMGYEIECFQLTKQ